MALAALIVSVIAIGIAVRVEMRAGRAERRDKRRAELEETEAKERRMGRPVISPGPVAGGPTAPEVTHTFMVGNMGRAAISELRLWIEDESGTVVSTRGGGQFPVPPGSTAAAVSVVLTQPLPVGELRVMVEWTDPEGTHRDDTGLRPLPHA